MRIFVNQRPVELSPEMTVRHALLRAGVLQELEAGLKVYDEWGHEVGLDGAISEGMKLFMK